MEQEQGANEQVAATLKVFVAFMPPSLMIYRFHVENRLLVGLSFIAGALLQALIPPWKMGLARGLTGVTLFTLVYSAWNPAWSSGVAYPLLLAAAVLLLVEGLARIFRYYRTHSKTGGPTSPTE